MNNIEQIADRLASAYRDKSLQIHPDLFAKDFNPTPESIACWKAVAEEAVRCRAEHFTDTVTGAAQTPKSDYLFNGLDQIDASRKAVAELNKDSHAAHEEAFRKQMQEANEAERQEFAVEPVSTAAADPNPHYDWMTEVRQIADKCLSNPHACPVDSVAQVISNWMRTAAQNQRNTDFYRDIVHRIGELFGDAAKTSDDGTVQQDVLALKVWECVNELVRLVPSIHTRSNKILGDVERLTGVNARLEEALNRNLRENGHLESVRADQAQQIRHLEAENHNLRQLNIHCSREASIRSQGTPGTYGWALEAMKRGEAVRRPEWNADVCFVIRRGVAPEPTQFCEHVQGVVYRAPGFDLHSPEGYAASNVSPADQLGNDWETVQH